MRCSTTHGSYRCMHSAGHPSDCEALDLSGLPTATGRRLDEIGDAFKVRRDGADDEAYRVRIWSRATA